MPTKKDIKKRSNDVFEKATGILLYKLKGRDEDQCCRVAPHTRTSYEGEQYQLGHIAAAIYLQKPAKSFKRVEHLCGIENCVLPSHLLIDGQKINSDSNGKILKGELTNPNEPDKNGFYYGYHPDIWNGLNEKGKDLCRKEEYDPGTHGFIDEYKK